MDPALYYFQATPFFETDAPQYYWLNITLAMSSGIREKERVVFDASEKCKGFFATDCQAFA